jgi:glycosyltransferase involved in cell wall biosynthesis
MFLLTSMPVGGAETLLVELVRRMNRERFLPELCCLKHLDTLGEKLAQEIPAFSGLLTGKYDFKVLGLLKQLLQERRTDAVVTIGPGDKMFWGRLAGWLSGVPVICSALHSTGLPDRVELPNRLLAPLNDAFIAVAEPHAQYLAKHEGCPAEKIRVIPNGIDTEKFHPRWPNTSLRQQLHLDEKTPTIGIVAALRPEKNHAMFLDVAARIHRRLPNARFLIIGDGPQRAKLESLAQSLGVGSVVDFLGTRSDVPQLLSILDLVLLTSHMEANPICLLEAMAMEKPVIATRVGSISQTVLDGRNGFLVAPSDSQKMTDHALQLLADPTLATTMGRAGREEVLAHWSVDRMVRGYEDLITEIYTQKCEKQLGTHPSSPSTVQPSPLAVAYPTPEIQPSNPEPQIPNP